MKQMKDAYEVLLSYEDEDLSEGDLVSKQIAVTMMGAVVEGERFRFHTFPVNQG